MFVFLSVENGSYASIKTSVQKQHKKENKCGGGLRWQKKNSNITVLYTAGVCS